MAEQMQNLGLVNALLHVMDSTPLNDPDHMIAEYLLTNYNRIGELNIYDVAAECYVSRSSIRRFCAKIGYQNFAQLKAPFKDFDYQYDYFLSLQERSDYRKWYEDEISLTVSEVNYCMPDSVLETLADEIHDHKDVYFLTSYSSAQAVQEFQRPLILLHKITHWMDDLNMDVEKLQGLGESAVIIVVSMMSNFAKANQDIIASCKARKLLITCSHNSMFEGVYDKIYYLCRRDYSNTKSIQGKIGLLYAFDLLYHVYLEKYGNDQ